MKEGNEFSIQKILFKLRLLLRIKRKKEVMWHDMDIHMFFFHYIYFFRIYIVNKQILKEDNLLSNLQQKEKNIEIK